MTENTDKNHVWNQWKVGTTDNDNELIDHIIGGGDDFPFIVYFVSSNNNLWLKWNFDRKKIKHAHTIEAIVHKYLFRAKENLSSKELALCKESIAGCIVNAFSQSFYEDNDSIKKGFNDCFSSIDEFLQSKDPAYIYSKYLFFATATLISFLILSIPFIFNLFNIQQNISTIIYGSIAGSVGAYISVLQRFNKIIKDKTSLELYSNSHSYIMRLEAITRIIIGCCFGGLVLVIQKSDLIELLNIKNNYSSILLGFAAGWSERFIPSLIKIIRKVDKDK